MAKRTGDKEVRGRGGKEARWQGKEARRQESKKARRQGDKKDKKARRRGGERAKRREGVGCGDKCRYDHAINRNKSITILWRFVVADVVGCGWLG